MNTATMPSLPPIRATRPRGGRQLLLLMASIFALPVLVVTGLFAIDWRPEKTANHGQLATAGGKVMMLPLDGLIGIDGKAMPAETLGGYWTLLLADGGPCSVACEARLATLRRIQVALGKGMPRVKRVWLSPAPASDPKLAALRERYPDLIVARPGTPEWQALSSQPNPAAQAAAAGAEPRFYVVDPAGRVALRYPEPFDPRGALRDIEKLLKYSWIG